MKFRTFFYSIICIAFFTHAQTNDLPDPAPYQTVEQPKPTPSQENYYVQPTNIGLLANNQNAIIATLRSLLADNYVLYTKTLNFHWNVQGELFSQLHEFFKTLYEHLQDGNDLLAEHIRALGGFSPGSLQEFLSLTQLKENSGTGMPYRTMIRILLGDFETIIRSVRTATEQSAEFNDWGTNNMLAGLLEKLEKDAWMIRAHLQK